MPQLFTTIARFARLYSPVFVSVAMFFLSGCMAMAGEAASLPGAIRLTWDTLLTIYGPMIIWVAIETRRNNENAKQRIEDEKERRKEEAEYRREWIAQVKINTEAITNMNTGVTLMRTDTEKHRTAIYRLVEEVKEITIKMNGMSDDAIRGNTRIMGRE